MDFALSGEQQALRARIIGDITGTLAEGLRQSNCQSGKAQDLWRELGKTGLHGLSVSRDYGGGGHGPLSTIIALEAFGYAGRASVLMEAAIRQLLFCTLPIWLLGDEKQKTDLLPALCKGTRIACAIDYRPVVRKDVARSRLTVEKSGDSYLVNGTCTISTPGPMPDLALLTVTDMKPCGDGDDIIFLLERGMHGVDFTANATGDDPGDCNWYLRLSGLELAGENALGPRREGQAGHNQARDWSRTCRYAGIIGATEVLFEEVVRHAAGYSRGCKLHAQPLGDFQSVTHRIAELKTDLEIARLLAYEAAWCLEHARPSGQRAALANLYAGEILITSVVRTMNTLLGFGLYEDSSLLHALLNACTNSVMTGVITHEKKSIARHLGLAEQ